MRFPEHVFYRCAVSKARTVNDGRSQKFEYLAAQFFGGEHNGQMQRV